MTRNYHILERRGLCMSIRRMEPDELKYCEIAARSHPIIIGASVISPFSTVQRYLSSSGILSCLKKDALVNEIKNGKRIQLNQSNYDTIEEEAKEEVEPEKKEEEKIIEAETTIEDSSTDVDDDVVSMSEEENKDEEEVETSITEEEVVEEKTETTTETPSYNTKNRKKKRH